jgi:hypothetical protein
MYALCELEPPFEDRMRNESEPLRLISNTYSEYLRMDILECLQHNPNDRPDAEELVPPRLFAEPSPAGNSDQIYFTGTADSAASNQSNKVSVGVALRQLETAIQSDFRIAWLQYRQLQRETRMENMEMKEVQAFWNPLESMPKKDATS